MRYYSDVCVVFFLSPSTQTAFASGSFGLFKTRPRGPGWGRGQADTPIHTQEARGRSQTTFGFPPSWVQVGSWNRIWDERRHERRVKRFISTRGRSPFGLSDVQHVIILVMNVIAEDYLKPFISIFTATFTDKFKLRLRDIFIYIYLYRKDM